MKHSTVVCCYQNEERKLRKITKWFPILYLGFLTVGIIVPILISSMIAMIQGNFDTSTWIYPFALDILWDTSNVFVWYLRTFQYILGAFTYALIVSAAIPYLSGCCLYIKASCKHLQSIFDECDDKAVSIGLLSGRINNTISIHRKIIE